MTMTNGCTHTFFSVNEPLLNGNRVGNEKTSESAQLDVLVCNVVFPGVALARKTS